MSECSVKHLKWGATWPSRGPINTKAKTRKQINTINNTKKIPNNIFTLL